MDRPIGTNFDIRPPALPDLHDAPSSQQSPAPAQATTPPAVAAKAPTSEAARSSGRALGSAFGRVLNGRDFETDQGFRSAISSGKETAADQRSLEVGLLQDEDYLRDWHETGIARQNSIMRRRDAEAKKGREK